MTLTDMYFKLTKEYMDKWGDKTILLMQVGEFYEVYGKRNAKKEYSGSHILEFANILDCVIANKQPGIAMAGYPKSQLDKLVQKISSSGFTVVVYKQDEFDKKHRSLYGIFSPGTNFNYREKELTNNIACVWIENHPKTLITKKPFILCGLSNIDIFTGKSNIFEFQEEFFSDSTPYDEIERFLSIYQPSEIIIIYSGFTKNNIQEIIQFSGCQTKAPPHLCDLASKDNYLSLQARKCEKQTYQKQILQQFYSPADWDFFYANGNYSNAPIATQSFCFLLDFIHSHNAELVKKIHEPFVDNIRERLVLANHSLKQLNIINSSQHTGKLSSVCSLLNECKTPMGKRKLNDIILNPTTNCDYLQKEYDITKYIKQHYEQFEFLRKEFLHFQDIEKLYRKIILNQVAPCELSQFYKNMKSIKKIYKKLREDPTIVTYLHMYIKDDVSLYCSKLMKILKTTINLTAASRVNTVRFDTNIFNRGIFVNLDDIQEKNADNMDKFYCIQKYLCDIILHVEKKVKNKTVVKEHATEKLGYSLIATNRRIGLLKERLKNKMEPTLTYISSYDNKERSFILDTMSFRYVNSVSNNKKIDSPLLSKLYSSITIMKIKLRNELSDVYKNFIDSLSVYSKEMESIVLYVSQLDVIVAKAHIAKKYNFCCPQLVKKKKSFLKAKDLRHCLIEHLQINETYTPNDVTLGDETDGILLYGTNAVGKSSLIRSIGISIVLAQAGIFVPCSSFEFKPYTAIFTRILGNDDIFKGLSTFATEMSELRTILNVANESSLILGDELCSGTETNSAIAIFVAGLETFHKKKSSFIFATHFHELSKMNEIKSLNNLSLKHMEVRYNKGILIYDRKLKDGPGRSMYGLEVCKSLNLPQTFLERANQIRLARMPTDRNVLSQNKSRYNAKKIRGNCEICNNVGVEVHHLNYQKNANDDGFIGHLPKNHLSNLINICEECHDKIHAENRQLRKVKTSEGMKLY